MQERTMDEMITHFNDTISTMDISRKDKMTLLGMITAIGYKYQQAADAIEELTDRNVGKWIPVTERLPEPNAVDKNGFAKGYLVKTDRHVMMHTARYNGKWWILWGKAEVITDTVTHWMPLPQPPKEET